MSFDESARPFLGRSIDVGSDSDDGRKGKLPVRKKRQPSGRPWLLRHKWTTIHCSALLIYTTITLFLLWHLTKLSPLNEGPLRDLNLRFESRIFPNLSGNPYWGQPSEKLEQAWDGLLAGMNIRVTADELAASKQESVPMQSGGGYLAWLSLHHDLHCLRLIHRYVYRDHYLPNRTIHEDDHMRLHMEHCLEMARQRALCSVDTTLRVFEWLPASEEPVFKIKEPPRQCVDWKAAVKSVRHRQISQAEVDALKNPSRPEQTEPPS